MQPRTRTLNRVSLCLCTFTLADGESGESALLISQQWIAPRDKTVGYGGQYTDPTLVVRVWTTGFQLANGEEFDESVRGGLSLACLGWHFCFSHGREGPFVGAKADTPLRRIGELPAKDIEALRYKAMEPAL